MTGYADIVAVINTEGGPSGDCGELWLLARAWHVARHMTGCTPSTARTDPVLDERSAATFSGSQPGEGTGPQSLRTRRGSAAGR
jgi:hypothetical protein